MSFFDDFVAMFIVVLLVSGTIIALLSFIWWKNFFLEGFVWRGMLGASFVVGLVYAMIQPTSTRRRTR